MGGKPAELTTKRDDRWRGNMMFLAWLYISLLFIHFQGLWSLTQARSVEHHVKTLRVKWKNMWLRSLSGFIGCNLVGEFCKSRDFTMNAPRNQPKCYSKPPRDVVVRSMATNWILWARWGWLNCRVTANSCFCMKIPSIFILHPLKSTGKSTYNALNLLKSLKNHEI